uniref:Uncharacterized protein n=1 Tax=Alexandrium catenella TaxID=2925 RepID=A0A7S1PN22_ALECA|mmetsp:Transcript_10484/g.28443  ORF Transcript_10484/g.28443 Transcript_10484/m.28443 type:complete len:268 (+) Transcript_10484:81-884(+)
MMVQLRALSSALVASCSVAALAADITSLVQRDTRLRSAGAVEPSSECKCLGWRDAYNKYGQLCGDGHEMDIAEGVTGPTAAGIATLSKPICWQYYINLPNDPFCMRKKWGTGESAEAEWCYVSPDCQKSMPAQRGKLHTKNCTRGPGKDIALGSLKFQQLVGWAYVNKIPSHLAAQFAYVTWPGMNFEDVQEFWGLEAPLYAAPITADVRNLLQAVADSGRATFMKGNAGEHPPYAVAEGKKFFIGTARESEDDISWSCVAGCAPSR